MSHLFKASILLTVFFGINKIVALIRQTLIAREFGLSKEIDAFNVANNLPDLLFSVFSGAALSFIFIPVFAEYIKEYGTISSWKLFSKTANVLFLSTAILSIIFAFFAKPLVESQFGISPGFSKPQQDLVVELMRINLVAMLIFSISGLIMASLQAHKHFFLTALAPILYNIGIIIGTVILSPTVAVKIAGISLPAFGLGIHGLVYGTVFGAFLHLAVQVPGIIKYKFRWTPSLDFKDKGVAKVLKLMLPRIATVFLIQLIFLTRDNLASRLPEGSVTALTYGYFIMQVPETLIGTAIATALFPTLSDLVSREKQHEFTQILNHSIRILIATTLATSLLLSIMLPYLIDILFTFDMSNKEILVWSTRGYLGGLISYCLLEVVTRAFYAKQNPMPPLWATILRTTLFLLVSLLFFNSLGAMGLALADSITVTVEVVFLLLLLRRQIPLIIIMPKSTIIRSLVGCIVSLVIMLAALSFFSLPQLPFILIILFLGSALYLLFIKQELKMMIKL